MLFFFILSIVVVCGIYVREKLKGASLKALLLKISTTVLIIFYSIFIVMTNQETLTIGLIIISALILGLIGDLVLDLKLIYPKDDTFYTYFGFGSFMLGHLIYIVYFLYQFPLSIISYSFIFGLAGVTIFIVLATEFPMKLNYGKFRIIVSVYAFVLSLIMFLSVWVGIKYSNNGILIFGIGMIFFLISDLILSQSYFGKNEKDWMIISNYTFYYGAQFLIASSLLFI